MAFHVGQKVVCIGGGPSKNSLSWWEEWRVEHGLTFPQRKVVYTVRDTRVAADGTQRIRLAEIINPPVPFTNAPNQEPWFQSVSFRPVVERKTDISIFTEMLTDTRVPAHVE